MAAPQSAGRQTRRAVDVCRHETAPGSRLEAAWGLALQATALRTAGQPFSQQSAMAKLYASEMVAFVTDTALQLHGGIGYTRALPLERYARDARILRIYEGASEVQRNIIARGVLA